MPNTIIYPQLDGVKINEDRTLPVALLQAIRKAYDYIAQEAGVKAKAAAGGGSGTGGGGTTGPDATGPVTGFTEAKEVGTRYAGEKDRLVHMTVGFVPIVPVPQSVTYLISQDNGLTWTWIGSQRMLTVGQELRVDQLAPGQDAQWMVAAVAGNLGGGSTAIPDSQLLTLYPGAVKSAPFFVAGLATPAPYYGITATIGSQYNVISADGLTQYGVIPGVYYTDPVGSTDFFVRITVQIYNGATPPVALANEQPYGGTQITGTGHTEADLLITYVPNLAWVRYRFYVANRNSQGAGDFTNTNTNTLQQVKFNGSATTADHYDVPITIPPFNPVDPGATFNVISVTGSEVGPKYQDTEAGLHTVVGIVPVIDHDYSSPRTVTIWIDYDDGHGPVWQGPHALTVAGQVVRIGDSYLNTDGVRKAGDIWVPANINQGNWTVYCGAGNLPKGIDPSAYAHSGFTVIPVQPCDPYGTSGAQFIFNPVTNDQIDYSLYDPGIWYWEYYELTFVPPMLSVDPNFWFTLITVQKGGTINGVWTPAPDPEGANSDPTLHFLGRVHDQIRQLPGVANDQAAVIQKFGQYPATWVIPSPTQPDGSPNPYTDFRFLLYNVSRLGTDTSGSGGAGTYTLQKGCWPGGADHYILTPHAPSAQLNIKAANPDSIALPLTGGNGQPLTVTAGGITAGYIGPAAVTANNMAKDSITAANQALAASSVVDPNIVTLGINKVTYGTSVFAGDVVLSRGPGLPVMVLANTGLTLFGQADASTGVSGLTSHPYVQIQSTGVKLNTGGGASTLLDAGTNTIFLYSKDGDVTNPYVSVATNGLTMVNGPCSVAINSNAINFTDTLLHNSLTMNSAGVTVANTAGNNKVVITSTDIQLQQAGVARVTINSSGITITNGGTASVTITATLVNIVNGSLSSPAINGGSITGTSLSIGTAQGTVSITNSTSGVEVSGSGGTNITHVGSTVISIYTTISSVSVGSEMSPTTLLVGRFGTSPILPIGLNANNGSMTIGSRTVIDANQIWREGVQCADHIIGNDFGITNVSFGWPQTASSGTPVPPGGYGPGAAPGVTQSFTTGSGRTVYVSGGLIVNVV